MGPAHHLSFKSFFFFSCLFLFPLSLSVVRKRKSSRPTVLWESFGCHDRAAGSSERDEVAEATVRRLKIPGFALASPPPLFFFLRYKTKEKKNLAHGACAVLVYRGASAGLLRPEPALALAPAPAPARVTWISPRKPRLLVPGLESEQRTVPWKSWRSEMKTTTPRSRCRVRVESTNDPGAVRPTIAKVSSGAGRESEDPRR